MKLIAKQHISGTDGTVEVGEVITVDDFLALRYIEKGIAEPRTKKELDAFMSKMEKLKEEQAKKEAEAKAIMEKEKIEVELNSLYLDVVNKEAELEGVVLTEEQTLNMVEELKNRKG